MCTNVLNWFYFNFYLCVLIHKTANCTLTTFKKYMVYFYLIDDILSKDKIQLKNRCFRGSNQNIVLLGVFLEKLES